MSSIIMEEMEFQWIQLKQAPALQSQKSYTARPPSYATGEPGVICFPQPTQKNMAPFIGQKENNGRRVRWIGLL